MNRRSFIRAVVAVPIVLLLPQLPSLAPVQAWEATPFSMTMDGMCMARYSANSAVHALADGIDAGIMRLLEVHQ